MNVLFAEKITAVADTKNDRGVPLPILSLFAKAGIHIPLAGKVTLPDVDAALKGLPIDERLRIKTQLKALNVID
jgi:hypothetical protein